MKLSETEDPAVRQQRLNYIEERWKQLNELLKESAGRANSYLLLTNAGGAAAMLAFLGANADIRNLFVARLSLALFAIGIILVGILDAMAYQQISKLFFTWRTNTLQFYKDEKDWGEMNAEDDTLAYHIIPQLIVAYASFACFIAGALIGIAGLLYFWPA